MAVESEHFVFTEVQWQQAESKEIRRCANPMRKIAPLSLTSYCKKCESLWVANRHGKDSFQVVVGGINVVCPNCNVKEFIKGHFFGKA